MASTSAPSSLGIRCGLARRSNANFCAPRKANFCVRRFLPSCSTAAAITPSDRAPAAAAEKLDQWMNESVVEIVKNISQAPFLVRVSAESGGTRLEREAADAGKWTEVRERWKAAPPDGVILVEELDGEMEEEEEEKTWGVLVQGRDCAACYVLRTCRVRSAAGFCTHFCLAKAKCFGDPAAAQLRGSWLLPR